ncbi:uncharacterized protein si:dkey-197j19.6 [Hoplias malabaricus]|uniref:uncharacterized protein si:dkey-197j19.6 n=1 Tax=Hoplias malabaricus TaxID=27720 RepID=UPI003462E1FC
MSRILSSLLSTRENGLLVRLLGQDCTVSACAVVQLLMAMTTSDGQKSEWKSHSYGVACLVQDRKLGSSFIRLFCVKKAKLIWEQELYTPFEYLAPCPYFHTFPGDDCRIGLNFSDEEEAAHFYASVQKCIKRTRAKPVFIRTHSLDSTSGWLLREKLNASLMRSVKGCRPALASGTNPVPSSTIMSPLSTAPNNLSKPYASSVSLAKKKGPLPPIPANANPASSMTYQNDDSSGFSIPLPPPYPAPKITPSGVRKSASFAPLIQEQRLSEDDQ